MHLDAPHDAADLAVSPVPTWKRFIDVALSGVALVLLSPVFLVVAVIIKISSRGPVLLKQQRVGRGQTAFTIWKFRTMHLDAAENMHQDHVNALIEMDVPMTKLDSRDPRVFPAGRVFRRSYMDELPQLVNVLRGEMSLVGPRPCLPYEAEQLKPWQRARFRALPGMTGLWQVSGKNKTTFLEMIRLDIAYAESLSLGGDLKILAKTVPVIFAELVERSVRSREAAQHINTQVMRKDP